MRFTKAIINSDNLIHNLNILKSFIGDASIMAIVKANGYGHGIIECSEILIENGVNYLGVAFPEEGIALRKAGITTPILVLVPAVPDEAEIIIEYDLEASITSIETLEVISNLAEENNKIVKAHLFIDTGMNRDGLKSDMALEFMQKAVHFKGVEVVGICTHFASADNPKSEFTRQQFVLFESVLVELKNNGFNFKFIHAANTGAILNSPESIFNLVRTGLFVYGFNHPNHTLEKIGLKPVLSLISKVRYIYYIKKGESVGYGQRFVADCDTNIAVIPIGYADGLFYSNYERGECLLKGKRYKIVGSICMDQCFVNLENDDISIGDDVVFIGEQGLETIYADEIAKNVNSIPYEILSSISARVPRIVV